MRESDQPPRKTPVPASEHAIPREPQSKHSEERELFLAGDGSAGPPASFAHHRAETLPDKLETATPNLASPQHIVNVLEAHPEEVLILDLRVSTQYARSCIRAALNLCVPTTLLKRPSYNVGRLTDTFKNDAQKTQFDKWETCNYIVVYDANTSQIKDAANCLNVLKKFTNEGWIGNAYIVRGGFAEFSSKFPDWIDQGDEAVSNTSTGKPTLNLQLGDKKIVPVIGGCPMPMTKSAANPFFGNIRQNMDLIGGVGQMDVRYPAAMTAQQKSVIPAWLKRAASASDEGKGVSDKFLNIEKGEQNACRTPYLVTCLMARPHPALQGKFRSLESKRVARTDITTSGHTSTLGSNYETSRPTDAIMLTPTTSLLLFLEKSTLQPKPPFQPRSPTSGPWCGNLAHVLW